MPGKPGLPGPRRTVLYQKLLEEVSSGPKTREYLMVRLARYVPFEKALRKAEDTRIRQWKRSHPDKPPPPRTKGRTLDEQVASGARQLIGQAMQTARASGRIVVEQIDPVRKGLRAGYQDIVRLQRPGEVQEVHRKRNERNRERGRRIRAEKAARDRAGEG